MPRHEGRRKRLVGSAALLGILLLSSATRPMATMEWLRGLFLVAVLTLAVRASVENHLARWAGTVLAVLAGVLVTRHDSDWQVGGYAVAILFLAFVTGALLRDVMRQREVSGATICDALSIYLLQAMLWLSVYALIEELVPGSFRGLPENVAPELAHEARIQALNYFSLVTLTTLGYGDVTPVSEWARTAATLEAVLGQLFLVVLVARLVAQHAAREDRGGARA